MRFRRKQYKSLLLGVCGITILVLGIVTVERKLLTSIVIDKIRMELPLVEGKVGFDLWKKPADFSLKMYLFDVLNPNEIMEGELPKLVERGPYVYDVFPQKEVKGINEDEDEIIYTLTLTHRFNKTKSGNVSDTDQITMLNTAYMGTITTIASGFASFMGQIGNNLPKLFPVQDSIFIKGKVKDIIFEGLPLTCNSKKYPELALICNVLKGKRPPTIRATNKPDDYRYSFLGKINGTVQGPFTMNRGVKNFSRLGDFTSIKGKRVLRNYRGQNCNTVSGSDGVTWPSMDERVEEMGCYILDACRKFSIKYVEDIVVNGIIGRKYALPESTWSPEEIECYCPVDSKKKPNCLPRGLQDISKCQEVPIIISEPHFLHGDPELLHFASGLNPVEDLHSTYLVIDPLAGAPLEVHEKFQLNMKLSKANVTLLSNVSEGYFPLIWFEQGALTNLNDIKYIIQAYRILYLIEFLQWVPVIVGIYMIFAALFLLDCKKTKTETAHPVSSTVVLPTHLPSNLTRRQQQAERRVFD